MTIVTRMLTRLLPRAVRVVGYLVVLALIAGNAVEAREGQKLGAYFNAGGKFGGLMVLLLAGYAAAILILTSKRVRLIRSALPIAIAGGTLTGAVPANGGCETCDPNNLVIPPGLRHEYWVGLSIAQANLPYYFALIFAPLFAVFGGGVGVGVGLGEASLRTRKRSDSARVC